MDQLLPLTQHRQRPNHLPKKKPKEARTLKNQNKIFRSNGE